MRLIDADAFERAVMFSDDADIQDVIYRLRDFPTVEPQSEQKLQPEIIHCKDCKHWMRAYLDISGKFGCNVMRDYTAPNDYCFKAERKEDAKNSVDM